MATGTQSKEELKAIQSLAIRVAFVLAIVVGFVSIGIAMLTVPFVHEQLVINGKPTFGLIVGSAIVEFIMLALAAKFLLYRRLLKPRKHYQLVMNDPAHKPIGRWVAIAIGTEVAISVVLTVLVNILQKDINMGSGVATFVACFLATHLTLNHLIKSGRAHIQLKD